MSSRSCSHTEEYFFLLKKIIAKLGMKWIHVIIIINYMFSSTVWHMPHGITLHLTPKNSNSYHLLWNYSTNLPASTTTGLAASTAHHNITSLRMGPLAHNFLRFSCQCCPLFTTSVSLPCPLSARLLHWRLQYFLLHIKPPWNFDDNFIAEIDFWLWIALIDTAHPQVHFSSSEKCQASSQKNPVQTTATSGTSYDRWWCTSRDLRPFAMSILINLFGITILLCLSPSKLGMAIYLINEIAFPPLTSNYTKWCAHLMSPSDQVSSLMDSSLSHLQCQQVTTCHSSNSVGYISRLLRTQFIQYCLCSCLDNNSSSPSLHFITACCSWMFHAQMRKLCSWGSCHACQEAASRYVQVRLLCSWGSWRAWGCSWLFLRLLTCKVSGRNFASPTCPCIHSSFTSSLVV